MCVCACVYVCVRVGVYVCVVCMCHVTLATEVITTCVTTMT